MRLPGRMSRRRSDGSFMSMADFACSALIAWWARDTVMAMLPRGCSTRPDRMLAAMSAADGDAALPTPGRRPTR